MADNPAKSPVRTRSPHHRVVYSNQVGTTTSNTDVRIRFGVVEAAGSDGMDVEDQVDVMIGPAMLVQLRDLLSGLIAKHFQEVEDQIKKIKDAKKAE